MFALPQSRRAERSLEVAGRCKLHRSVNKTESRSPREFLQPEGCAPAAFTEALLLLRSSAFGLASALGLRISRFARFCNVAAQQSIGSP
jgi:hypothetical protein